MSLAVDRKWQRSRPQADWSTSETSSKDLAARQLGQPGSL